MALNKIYRLLLVSGTLLLTLQAPAQTFAEWFQQKKTQKSYLLQQIEALQVFSGYLQKGYAVAKGGLGSITNSILTENGLHNSYYTSLRKANPAVAGKGQVKEIVSWQMDIANLFASLDRLAGLTSMEKKYLQSVRTAVLDDCEKLLSTLQNVISDNKVEMSDADRLKLIQRLHSEMQENYRFATGFTGQAKTYVQQRLQETNNTHTIKQVYGLN